MKSAADDNSRTLHCMHCALAINCWHLLHFTALSFFTARVLRLAPTFPFSFFDFFFFSAVSFSPLRHAREGREGKPRLTCALHSVHVCTYVSISRRHVGGKRVRVSRDANYLFYVPTGTPWEVHSKFSRNAGVRDRTSAVPNETGLLKETSEFFYQLFLRNCR